MKDDASFRARSRAHSLLLSAHGTTIKDIAKTSQVHRVTVSAWITPWEHHGAQSLHDKPRSGRPRTLSPEERALALQYIKEEPHGLKGVAERVAAQTDKRLSLSSLKRLAKKARLRGKRVRKSLKSLRAPDAFATAKRELAALQHQEDHGKIAILMNPALPLIPRFPMPGKNPSASSSCLPGELGGSMCSGL
jgi:transposase